MPNSNRKLTLENSKITTLFPVKLNIMAKIAFQTFLEKISDISSFKFP